MARSTAVETSLGREKTSLGREKQAWSDANKHGAMQTSMGTKETSSERCRKARQVRGDCMRLVASRKLKAQRRATSDKMGYDARIASQGKRGSDEHGARRVAG